MELEIQKMRDQLLANANLLADPTITKSSFARREERPTSGITDITLIVRQQEIIADLRKKWEVALQKQRRTELINETARLLDFLHTDSVIESYDQDTIISFESKGSGYRRDPFEDEPLSMDVEYLAKELSLYVYWFLSSPFL